MAQMYLRIINFYRHLCSSLMNKAILQIEIKKDNKQGTETRAGNEVL
jgi:hypothetical protein